MTIGIKHNSHCVYVTLLETINESIAIAIISDARPRCVCAPRSARRRRRRTMMTYAHVTPATHAFLTSRHRREVRSPAVRTCASKLQHRWRIQLVSALWIAPRGVMKGVNQSRCFARRGDGGWEDDGRGEEGMKGEGKEALPASNVSGIDRRRGEPAPTLTVWSITLSGLVACIPKIARKARFAALWWNIYESWSTVNFRLWTARPLASKLNRQILLLSIFASLIGQSFSSTRPSFVKLLRFPIKLNRSKTGPVGTGCHQVETSTTMFCVHEVDVTFQLAHSIPPSTS